MKLNLKRVFIILGCLFVSLSLFQFFISCELNTAGLISPLSSSDSTNNNDNTQSTRICDDRDSCRESCEYIFKNSSAKSDCYDLDFDELNDYERVFDELSSKNLNKRDLEKIDEDAFRDFLKLSVNGWLDLIDGSRDGGTRKVREAYTVLEAREALEWIAENEDIADAIADHDEDRDILYELFLIYGSASDDNLTGLRFLTDASSDTNIIWKPNQLDIGTSSSNVESVNLNGFRGGEVFDFIISYMGLSKTGLGEDSNDDDFSFRNDSFVQYAESENNDSAVDLAHSTLVEFCKDAVSEDDDDEDDVKRCLLAVYCSIETKDNSHFDISTAFDESFNTNGVPESFDNFFQSSPFRLDDNGDEMCSYDTFKNDDNQLDNYF